MSNFGRIDSKEYLKSFGWQEGTALRDGGLKKPILVKHKRDRKGLGNAPGGDDSDMWWERLFDVQLKGLDVSQSSKKGVKITQKEVKASDVRKEDSPLYKWFVKGEGLKGSIKQETSVEETTETIRLENKKRRATFDDLEDSKKLKKKLKKEKKSKEATKKAKKEEKKIKKQEKKAKKEAKKAKKEAKKAKKEAKKTKKLIGKEISE